MFVHRPVAVTTVAVAGHGTPDGELADYRKTVSSAVANNAKRNCADVGAVEGMVYSSTTGWLYWTSSSAAAVRGARLFEVSRAPPDRKARLVQTVVRLRAGARPRGIDFEPCTK